MDENQNKKINKDMVTAKDISKLVAVICATNSGKAFMNLMMRQCGFLVSSLVYNERKEINKDALVVNEVLRNFYLNLRNYIPAHQRAEIEAFDLLAYVKKERTDE